MTNIFNDLGDFVVDMQKVLEEKQKEQQDKWKTCELELLHNKMTLQFVSLKFITEPQRSMRKLLHIANYCYFLYTRLRVDLK